MRDGGAKNAAGPGAILTGALNVECAQRGVWDFGWSNSLVEDNFFQNRKL